MNLQATTTRYTPVASKPFAWSYTKLKNFEACPKRHYHVDVLPKGHPDKVVEEESDALKYGNTVHMVMDQYLRKGIVMPPVLEPELLPWIERVFTYKTAANPQGRDVRSLGAKIHAEQQLAINKDFAPVEWFAKDAWYRNKVDVMWELGPVGGVIDWKTGKVLEDSVQLMLAAATTFAHYPHLQVIRSTFAWLAEDATTDVDIPRERLPELWSNIWERIETLKHAHETTSYPARPNRLCRKWCPVKQCPHHGQAYGD
jgi:hypothetical protein